MMAHANYKLFRINHCLLKKKGLMPVGDEDSFSFTGSIFCNTAHMLVHGCRGAHSVELYEFLTFGIRKRLFSWYGKRFINWYGE